MFPNAPGGQETPAQQTPAILKLAREYYQQRRFDDAITVIRPLIQQRPADFEALSLYGMALKYSGANREAAEILRRALAITESPLLRRALEEVSAGATWWAPAPPGANSPAAPPPAAPPPAARLPAARPAAAPPPFARPPAAPPPAAQPPVAQPPVAQPQAAQSLASQLGAGPPAPVPGGDQLRGALMYQWHRSIFSFLGFWFGLLFIIAGVAVDLKVQTSKEPLLVSAFGALLFLWAVLRCATTRYTVYERRIDFASGILFQRRVPVLLYDISDVSMHRSPLTAGKSAIDIHYDTKQKKSGSKSLIGVASTATMTQFLEHLQATSQQQRYAVKKQWI